MPLRLLAPLAVLGLAAPASASALDVSFGSSLRYAPDPARIAQGESITWRGNFGEHPISSAGGEFADRARGGAYTVAFGTPGTYVYYCQLHSDGVQGMVARVIVRAASGAPGVAARPRVRAPRRVSERASTIRVTTLGATTISATLEDSGVALAAARAKVTRAGTRALALRLTAAGRERLRASSRVQATLRVRLTTQGGRVTAFTRPLELIR